MPTTPQPDRLAHELIESETFTPEETVEVLVGKGHAREDAKRWVAEAVEEIERSEASPARKAAVARGRRGARLIRAGIFVGVVGLGVSFLGKPGILYPLMVYLLAATLVITGFRIRRTG